MSQCTGGLFNSKKDSFSEGRIEYRASFQGGDLEPLLRSALPNSLCVYFKKPLVRTEIKSMGGLASIVSIVNTESGESHVLVSVVGVKSHYQELISKNQISLLFDSDNMLELTDLTTQDTTFLGYSCVSAKATLGDRESDRCVAIIAPEIGWEGMNRFSPFQNISGAVLRGFMQVAGIKVEVTAVNLKPQQVKDSLFVVPEGYKDIDRTALQQLLGLDLN